MNKQNRLWLTVAGVLLMSFLSCSQERWNSDVVGTWKGIDVHGNEYYFEFNQDGTLTWWNIDRKNEDGTSSKGGTFKGWYKRGSNGQLELTDGFQSLGVLRGGRNELTQDDSGHLMRRRLTYRKVQGQ